MRGAPGEKGLCQRQLTAPGRDDTRTCHRRRLPALAAGASLNLAAQSSVTSVVMSAMEKREPATKSRPARCASIISKGEEARASALRQFRDLRVIDGAGQGAALEAGRGVAKRLHHGVEAVPLGAALPFGHDRALLRALAEQPRLRLNVLEILANGDGVSDPDPIIKLENRDRRVGIDRAEGGASCSPARRSTCTFGTAIFFSARKMRTRRGLGAVAQS